MTIDEVIVNEKSRAENCKGHYDRFVQMESEEHERIAEWLEELKAYRTLDKTNFSDEYNRAIDDFKSRLEERILAGKMIDEKFAYIDNCDIDEIAEQLKAGGENES